VSGTLGEDVAVQAMKAGAHDYVMKNNLARLVPAMERELGEESDIKTLQPFECIDDRFARWWAFDLVQCERQNPGGNVPLKSPNPADAEGSDALRSTWYSRTVRILSSLG
jgi:hypothetical protein